MAIICICECGGTVHLNTSKNRLECNVCGTIKHRRRGVILTMCHGAKLVTIKPPQETWLDRMLGMVLNTI